MLRVCFAFLIYIGVCNYVNADVIVFVDGQTLECKIIEEDESSILVEVYKDSKTHCVGIKRSRISKIIPDYETMIAGIKDDDADAMFDAGIAAEGLGLFEDALSWYMKVAALGAKKDEIHYRLGMIYSRLSRWSEAEKEYQKHLQGTSSEERSKEVRRLLGDVRNRKNEGEELLNKGANEKSTNGFEAAFGWRVESWGNTGVIRTQLVEDNSVLSFRYEKGKKADKAAISIRLRGSKNNGIDASNSKELSMFVYNASKKAVNISIIIVTAVDSFCETTMFRIPPNEWTPLVVDLESKRFKSAATDWTHSASLSDRSAVRQIGVMVYDTTSGLLHFDRIVFK